MRQELECGVVKPFPWSYMYTPITSFLSFGTMYTYSIYMYMYRAV